MTDFPPTPDKDSQDGGVPQDDGDAAKGGGVPRPQDDEYDPAGAGLTLAELLRELEGSTHGGPRHNALYESLKRLVDQRPMVAFDQIEHSPSSARSVLLMAVSGVGRRILESILDRMSHPSESTRRDAAMILCIWATRGLLSGADRPAIHRVRDHLPADDSATVILDNALSRLRT